MKKTLFNKAIFPCLLFLVACTNDIKIENIEKNSDIYTIEVTANDFVYDDIQTRTSFEITESGVKFTWAVNDTLGIFPNEGLQVYFPMASGAGSNKASFTGGGWALKPSSNYTAYYPLVGKFYLDKQAIPISYMGQTQVNNATTDHLGEYDYMVAAASTPTEGKVNFNFNRLNSLIRLNIVAPVGSSYTQIKLESEGLFLNKGSLDLSTQNITYSETSNTFFLNLEDITTTAGNNTLVLYLMLAPTDLSEKEITATIIDDNNNSTTTTFTGRNFVAGKVYNLTEVKKIPISIATEITGATDTHFEQSDEMGLFVVNYYGLTAGTLASSGNYMDNMRFTYSDSWMPNEEIFWKDQSTKADFYSYYPYTSRISDVSAYTFAVNADQSSEANYKASEFLWGKTTGVAPTQNSVNISMNHVMSNLIIKLIAGDGYSNDDLVSSQIYICGLKPNATINLATGEVTPTGSAADIIPRKESAQYRALVVPQSVTDIDLVRVTIGDDTYLLNQSINFVSNKQYTATITVNRTSQGLNIGINGWEEDDTDYGGTVE